MRFLFVTVLLASMTSPALADDTSGVPRRVVEIIQEQYGSLQPDQRDQIYAMYRPVAAEFQQRWSAYAKRKKRVDAALAKSASLEKSGDLAGAEAALAAVITDLPVRGSIPQRGFLEPYDAEWPALEALARVALARRSDDYPALPTLLDACAGLWLRRSIASRDEEMWLYFVDDSRSNPSARSLTNYPEPKRANDAILDERKEGPTAAHTLVRESGLPADLVGYLEDHGLRYYDRWPKAFVDTAGPIDEFMTRWRDYRTRAVLVAAAVAESEPLEQTGDLAEARAALEAVVTAAPLASDGKPDRQRGWIEVRDAELPAIRALERVLAKQGDVQALSRFFAHRFVRRPVDGLEKELAAHLLRGNRRYSGSGGKRLATELWTVFEKQGVAFGNQEKAGVAKGAPMLLYVNTRASSETKLDVSAKAVRFDATIEYREHYDCRTTDQIERIESDGYVRYRETCKSRLKKARFKLDAKLATPAPEWARSKPPRWLYVAGKVTRTGPKWKMVDAEIVDLSFL